jgi:hypothetical protein
MMMQERANCNISLAAELPRRIGNGSDSTPVPAGAAAMRGRQTQ